MSKRFKKIVAIFLCVLLAFSVCQTAVAAPEGAEPASSEGHAFTDDDFLTTSGRDIVNRKGEKVRLRGVNLGAWLIWEDWLCPYTIDGKGGETLAHADVLDRLEERFGIEKAYELYNTYMDNFITEQDFDNIADMGFNCVRLPFWFRNFYYDEEGTQKILNDKGEWDFSRLDWAVEQCAKRGIYVILDMHGAVGYQGDAEHCGKLDSCKLYERSQAGENYRQRTAELWAAIAERFKGNPAVAMYDLLNEPSCDNEGLEINRRINNTNIYKILYKAVRDVDPDHVITLECIWTAAALPHPELMGWENVVYQIHFYQKSNFIFNFFVFLTRLYYSRIPLIMGEYFPLGKTTWANTFETMEKCNVNWCLWTYKAMNDWMSNSEWAIYANNNWEHNIERADIDNDSYEEIARKWGERLKTDSGVFSQTGHYENNVKQWLPVSE